MDLLQELEENFPHTIALRLKRNYGQTAALDAGFQASRGRVVVALDADGQNDPHDIYSLVDALEPEFDCVSGWRQNRQDARLARKLPSQIANWLIAKATSIPIHDSGCTLKAYRGDALRDLTLYGEMHRLIPFYIYLAGGRITERPVNHRARIHGKSKYGLSRTFRVLQDIVVAKVQDQFSKRPMHLFGNVALFIFLIGTVLALTAATLKVLGIRTLVDTPLLVLGAFFFLGSLQIFSTGLITEILLRKLYLASDKRDYRLEFTDNVRN